MHAWITSKGEVSRTSVSGVESLEWLRGHALVQQLSGGVGLAQQLRGCLPKVANLILKPLQEATPTPLNSQCPLSVHCTEGVLTAEVSYWSNLSQLCVLHSVQVNGANVGEVVEDVLGFDGLSTCR